MRFLFLKFPIQDIEEIKNLQQLRERLLNALLLSAFVMGTVVYATALIPVYQRNLLQFPLVYTVLYVWLILVTFVKRIPYRVRAGSWLIFFYLLGLINLVLSGLNVDGGLFFLTFVSMAALLFDLRRGMIALGISGATMVLAGYAVILGYIDLQLALPQTAPLLWVIGGMIFVVAGIFLILSISVLVRGLVLNLTKATLEAEQLEQANRALQVSEERYRTLVEISPDLITLVGLDGKIIMTNRPGLALFGYELSEVSGRDFLIFISPEEHSHMEASFQKTLNSGADRDVVCRCVRKDGTTFYAEFSASLLRGVDGRPQAVIGVGKDVTVRRNAELLLQDAREKLENEVLERTAELRSVNERLKELVSHSPAVIYVARVEENYPSVFVSENISDLLGLPADQYTNDPLLWMNNIHPEDAARAQADFSRIVDLGEMTSEYRVRHQDGEYRWIRDSARLIHVPGSQPREMVGSMVDITRLKQAEESYKNLLENSMQGIIVFQDGQIAYANRAIFESFGFELDEARSLTSEQIVSLIHPDDRALMWSRYQARLDGQSLSQHQEMRIFQKNGEMRYLDVSTVPITYDGRLALLTTAVDLTERKKMEQALRDSEETGRVILNATPDTLILFDLEGRILAANRITAQKLGMKLDDLPGKTLFDLFPQEVAKIRTAYHEKVIQTGRPHHFEDHLVGRWLDVFVYPVFDVDGQVTRVVISARDITERKQMEQSLQTAKNELELRVAERTRELTESQEQLRKLTTEVVFAQEEERRRVSRELHDEAGQALVSMKYGLEAVLADLKDQAAPVKNRLVSAVQQLDQTMEQIRFLAHSLRPPLLDIADLDLTLRDYCREFSESTGLQVDYEGEPVSNLTDQAELGFFRFLQEALTNVAKHARATRVQVRLRKRAHQLSLLVADNGVGYTAAMSPGQGHMGMHERFRGLNGRIQIKSSSGFVIKATIPYQHESGENRLGS